MAEFLSADHIAAQAGAFEPQRKNNFTLVFDFNQRIYQQALHSFQLPKESNAPIAVKYGNEERKVAGVAQYEALTLVLKDYADQPAMAAIIEWRRTVYEPSTGVIHLAKEYKKQGQVKMMAPDGTLIRSWKLIGMWPSSADPGDGAMDENTQNLVTAKIEIDKAIEENLG